LQHLSNTEIIKILDKCRQFAFVIVTEHYPHPDRDIAPNVDIPHEPEIRLHFDSGVYLDKPPFDRQIAALLLDAEADEGTRIKSILIKN
jgi:hypothetical protein